MEDKERPILVGVFGDRSRAERAAYDLQANGYGDDELGVVWNEATGLCGAGGLVPTMENDISPHLVRLGVSEVTSAYYHREVTAGRCLLLVSGAHGPEHARKAIGRNCGTVHLPEEAKAA